MKHRRPAPKVARRPERYDEAKRAATPAFRWLACRDVAVIPASGMSVAIAKMGRGDVDAVSQLLAAQLQEHGVELPDGRVRAGVTGLFEEPSRGAILVARESNTVVGIAVLATTWTVEHGGPVAWLDELYVTPVARDRGVGQSLLDAAIAEATGRGCIAVELEVDVEHARAERLYARNGFTRLARARWVRELGADFGGDAGVETARARAQQGRAPQRE